MKYRNARPAIMAGALFLTLSGSANAAMYVYDQPFGEGVVTKPVPDGVAPWLSFTTADVGLNQVSLILRADLGADNFISSVYFNLDPAFSASNLSYISSSSGTSVTALVTDPAKNALKADGDGTYDFRIDFLDNFNRFDGTDTVTLTLSSSEAIDAGSFGFFSEPPTGGNGPYISAAHVQGISDPAGSTWIAATPVPVPIAAFLLTSVLPLLAFRRRTSADSLARAL